MKRMVCAFFALLLLCACAGTPDLSNARPYEPIEDTVMLEEIEPTNEPDPMRRAVVRAALSLVGKVSYFWGGKNKEIAPDPAWGELRLVESPGSETTGTMQPWGLDCSGFTSWCFMQTGMDWETMLKRFGNGTKNQYYKSHAIDWDDLLIGDLIFQYSPLENKGNHVGIVVGFDNEGEPLIAHCAYSMGGVVITGRGAVFTRPRRPNCYGDGESASLSFAESELVLSSEQEMQTWLSVRAEVAEDGAYLPVETLVSLRIRGTANTIPDAAFSDCVNLETVSIASELRAIGKDAFRHCAIETLVLPASLETIGENAFASEHLYAVLFLGAPPKTPDDGIFFVPAEYGDELSVTVYYLNENAALWANEGETVWNGASIVGIDSIEDLPNDPA